MITGAEGHAGALSELKLDRQLLTIFVIGPGFGESVLIAVPRSEGWIVIDGAAPQSAPPAKDILERHWSAGSAIELLLLTHPHADHHAGLIKILDDARLGPAVRRIGCVSHYVAAAHEPGNTSWLEAEALFHGIDVDDPEVRRELGGALAVLKRIGDEWRKCPDRRWLALQGANLEPGGDLRLRVLGPARKHVEEFFAAPNLAGRIRHSANDLSAVLELQFGATRVLLGGDLPDRREQTPVVSGWSHVCSVFPELNEHTGYKVAHHASEEAIHPGVVEAYGRSRSWLATPCSKGATLPRFEENGGVHRLQAFEKELLLTAMPARIKAQVPQPERVRRVDLAPATLTLQRPTGRLGPPVAAGRIATVAPTECVWAVQFDDSGNTVGRYRGQAATIVT